MYLHVISQIISILIKYGVNINAKNKMEKTALNIAVNKNDKEICEMLIKHGAVVSFNSKTYTKCNIYEFKINVFKISKNSVEKVINLKETYLAYVYLNLFISFNLLTSTSVPILQD